MDRKGQAAPAQAAAVPAQASERGGAQQPHHSQYPGFQGRVIAEQTSSREGLILNSIYSSINHGAAIMQEGLAWMVVRIWVKDDNEIQAPPPQRAYRIHLARFFSPTEIGRIWRGLGQEIKQQMRHDGKRYSFLLITDPERLDFEFKKYVPDAVDVLKDVYLEKGIDSFSSPPSMEISPATKPPLPVESVLVVPEKLLCTPITYFSNNNNDNINNSSENHLDPILRVQCRRELPDEMEHYLPFEHQTQYPLHKTHANPVQLLYTR